MNSLAPEPPGKPKNTGVGILSLLQGNFLTRELNWGISHCRQILYQLSHIAPAIYFSLFPTSSFSVQGKLEAILCTKSVLPQYSRSCSTEWVTCYEGVTNLDSWGVINFSGDSQETEVGLEEMNLSPALKLTLLSWSTHPTAQCGYRLDSSAILERGYLELGFLSAAWSRTQNWFELWPTVAQWSGPSHFTCKLSSLPGSYCAMGTLKVWPILLIVIASMKLPRLTLRGFGELWVPPMGPEGSSGKLTENFSSVESFLIMKFCLSPGAYIRIFSC